MVGEEEEQEEEEEVEEEVAAWTKSELERTVTPNHQR